MIIVDLLRRAADAGVFLTYEQDALRYKLTSEVFPEQLREEILSQRDALISFLKENSTGALAARPFEAIPRCDRATATFPTSCAQRRLWFVDQLLGGSPQYNMPVALRVGGRFDERCAERALARLIDRHEPLRTVFVPGSAGPLQQIRDAHDFHLECVDLRSQHVAEQAARIECAIANEAARPFDLSADLMLRALFLRCADEQGVLLLNMHHIAVDGWSLSVVAREFVQLYEAELGGTGALPNLPIQYVDYAVWQQQQLASDSLQRQMLYWQEQLKDVPELHDLPTDRPRPQRQRFKGGKVQASLGAAALAELKALAKTRGATLYMVLHAALTVVLARISGSRDIVIGAPIANRRQARLDGLVGFFVNMLVLRSRIDGDPRFIDYLEEIRSLHLQAQANQDVPFEYLVERLNPRRALSHAALVQIALSLDIEELPALCLPGATLTPLPSDRVAAKFDLLVAARERADGLGIELEYDADLFEQDTAARLAECFVTVLASIGNDSTRTLLGLQLLPADQSDLVIRRFNETAAWYPPDVCLHELFERQVEKTPEAVALTFEGRSLTYRQLNERANQLAHYLRARGVKPDTCVAICAQRSIEMVIGIFGTLKAGGAYVPFDPAYPADRLAYMAMDSAPTMVLTCGDMSEVLPPYIERLRFDADSVPFAGCSTENLPVAAIGLRPDHLAYVIYTSGSTGQPKGVMNEHAAVVNGLRWGLTAYPLDADDAVVQKTPFSFDVSVWEFMLPLFAGARLVLARPGGHRDPKYLAELIERERITMVHFVPSMLQAFLEQGVSERCQRVRRILCSGEALSPVLQRRCQASFPQAELHNLYGPTEAAVHATALHCRSDAHPGIVPIGRPLANTQAYILDEQLQPVPVGAVGELYLGGAGVARGYLNRRELTQERFVRDPFLPARGTRLYKTGDLCRWLRDGNIQYLGRNDFQVKIRGLRIELGEIEQQLSRAPHVKTAVVVAREDEHGQKQLIAYVCIEAAVRAQRQSSEWLELLRGQVRQQLPEYMLPGSFMLVDDLPLTLSGKVDRKALPAPPAVICDHGFVCPRTGTEAALAEIWGELLDRPADTVSADANFFEVGGHSLLAVRLVAHIRARFGVELPLQEVFAATRLSELARLIEESRGATVRRAIAAQPRNGDAIPASFSQQRIWFIEQMVPGSAQYNMAGGMRVRGAFDADIAEQALIHLIRRHEPLRTVYAAGERGPVQRIQSTFDFLLRRIDLTQLAAAEQPHAVDKLLIEQARRPFDLCRDLMLRGTFVRLRDDEGVLLFNLHHIAADGWSLRVLLREFAQLYDAIRHGDPDPLPPLAIQYADYAVWQHEALRSELDAQLAYWQRQLDDLPSVHTLPLDRPRPALQTYSGAVHRIVVESELLQALKRLAVSCEATLFMVLHAAYTILLARHSNNCDIVIGTPVANRLHAQLEALVGCFVNMLVLRTECQAQSSFSEYLAYVKALNVDAQANQDVPFEYLVERLNPVRSASHAPLFQITLAAGSQLASPGSATAPRDLQGLRFEPLAHAADGVKYDLSLEFEESQQGLELSFTYNSDLFEPATVAKLGERMCALLRSIAQAPQSKVSELQLLPEAERRHLLYHLNDTFAAYPRSSCLHELFEEQVRKTPRAVALICEERQLRYAEVNERANQLARYLREQGVGAEKLVGICMERSLELVIGMLAILKAGGAYVPLDPSYPRQRLQYMANDSEMRWVLTQGGSAAGLELEPVRRIELDSAEVSAGLQKQSTEDLPRAAGQCAWSLAYVIYTSGSTGQPKGVMVEHRAAVNLICGMRSRLPRVAGRSWLLLTSVGFDIALYEWLGCVTSGECCVIASEAQQQDVYSLQQLLARHEIGLMQATPPRWQQLLEAGWSGTKGLVGLCGGEALTRELEVQLRRAGVRLWNCYGPTEATVWSLLNAVNEADAPRKRVSLGRGLPNYRHLVLDAQQTLVPFGAVGELYIGGPSLARGYWKRAELTRERFIADPYAAGERLYRTGDLVRYLADGSVEFLGRTDHQVKIRGHRIELGEIEQQLCSLAPVRCAVVVVRETPSQQKRLVAYVTVRTDARDAEPASEPIGAQLRSALRDRLPSYMVPEGLVVIDELPLTPNGKVDRKALPAGQLPTDLESRYVAPTAQIEKQLCEIWQHVLETPRVGVRDSFFEIGGNSLLTVRVRDAIAKQLGHELALTDLFEYPTIEQLARHLSGEARPNESAGAATSVREAGSGAIAIIGMSGRFPGAANVAQYWANISEGVESLRSYSDAELLAAGCDAGLLAAPNYVKCGVMLDGIEELDAVFFGLTPREAELLDPQQRLLLECAVEALEHAGYGNTSARQHVGVFVGTMDSVYLLSHILPSIGLADPALMNARLANSRDFAATRLSYKLNLTGPSVTVATACSTSLVAVHQACSSLQRGECEMALAGGANVTSLRPQGYLYVEGDIRSPDGRCRAFDKGARGTRNGDGAGLVLLKRLDDALRDGDTVHAIIKGSAINNDASDKVGYTAPAVTGQIAAIQAAHREAGVDPNTIQYVEAHGTGTTLGDPIEVRALTAAFATQRRQYCALGSVKPNIGHLDAAAGIAGLLKTVAAVAARQLPPAINFQEPNPVIEFERSPFYVNTALREWIRGETPRRAAVSSFGIGGTNAHVVIEEAPEREIAQSHAGAQLLLLSAKSEPALQELRADLAAVLGRGDQPALADVAYTLQVGRAAHAWRDTIVCRDAQDATRQLREHEAASVGSSLADNAPRLSIAFMFPGQGSQYPGMARGLYEQEPQFRASVDECARLFSPLVGMDLRELLNASDADDGSQQSARINATVLTQPALFTVEYALANLLQSWGMKPAAMIGHSLGEYVAACLAGAFSLSDAARLIATRGRLMQRMAPGQMLAVELSEEQLQPLADATGCTIAAINERGSCVASGSADAVTRLHTALDAQGVSWRKLHTSHAFHSPMVDPILEEFAGAVQSVTRARPRIPYVSSVTGTYVSSTEATTVGYWTRQLREPVRFSAGLATLLADAQRDGRRVALLEVGPGTSLSAFARNATRGSDAVVASTMRHPRNGDDDSAVLLAALGKIWLAGAEIDWRRMHAQPRRRVPLPTYPFQRQRYWMEPPKAGATHAAGVTGDREVDVNSSFYAPTWSLRPLGVRRRDAVPQVWRWLVFCDRLGLGERIAERLRATGHEIVCVRAADRFAKVDALNYALQPGDAYHYELLASSLRADERSPERVLHSFSIGPMPTSGPTEHRFDLQQDHGAYSLLHLLQELGARAAGATLQVDVLTAGALRITGQEAMNPAAATVCGVCKVAAQEYAGLSCHVLDVGDSLDASASDDELSRLTRRLIAELTAAERSREAAYRGGCRWIRSYSSSIPSEGASPPTRLRRGGVYLLTGGMGRIGLALAERLASTVEDVRLILVGRTEFPARSQWSERLAHPDIGEIGRKIALLQSLENRGAQILVATADVANIEQMEQVFTLAQRRFGAVDGVIHCAGRLHGAAKPIQALCKQDFEDQYRSKVHGTLVLERLLRGKPVDFCLLMSSLSAVLGGLGFAAYAAANSFMDAFAQAKHAEGDERWLSVNWDAWLFEDATALGSRTHYGMTVEQGLRAFEHVLNLDAMAQLVHCTGSLAERLRKWVEQRFTAPERPTLYARAARRGELRRPGNDIERRLLENWQELLGIADIGIDENFFELGGDSLLATRAVNFVRTAFALSNAQFSIVDFFTEPVIAEIARKVSAGLTSGRALDQRRKLLHEGKGVEEGAL